MLLKSREPSFIYRVWHIRGEVAVTLMIITRLGGRGRCGTKGQPSSSFPPPSHRTTPFIPFYCTSMSSSGHEAPPEIVEIILSYLRNDVPALARCSLVDRGWLSMSRRWLFEDVDMTTFRATSRQARFHKFMNLFERSRPTAPCTLSKHIQCLTLDPTFTPYQISGLATLDLLNLRAIRIKASSVSVPPYLLSSVSTIFSEKIRRLDITSLVFPTPMALVEFVSGFPHLEHLALGDSAFVKEEWRPPANSLWLSPKLTSLRWSQRLGIIKGEVRGWLLGQIQQREIEIKSLEFIANGWCDTFPSDVFATLAEKVEQLDIHLSLPDNGIFTREPSPHLRRCSPLVY